jgi:hypothetical protein
MWLDGEQMKVKFIAALTGVLFIAIGCVKTVNDRHTAAVPFVTDKVEGRYERSVDQVYEAAKEVIKFNGSLLRESTLLGGTNAVRTLEGKVKQRTVWVRVEAVEPKVTSVKVQARTSAGGTDVALVHELDKQIALQLAR